MSDKYADRARAAQHRNEHDLIELRQRQADQAPDNARQCLNRFGELKTGFETRYDAKRSPGGRAGLRPYQCRVCGMWHLTKLDAAIPA